MSGKKGMKQTKKRKHLTQEQKDKIRQTMKEKWKDKEYRERMSNAHKHELPDEWKQNISKGMKGKRKKLKTRIKMSKYQSNRTDEHEKNFRESWKKQWNGLTKQEQLDRLSNWIEAGHKSFNSFSLKPTSIELKVKEQLDYYGIRYIQQKHINDGERNYYLDFYIPSFKLVIECNGDYWHNKQDRKERDRRLETYVKSTGRNIVFIWEHEINDEWFCILDYLPYESVVMLYD